MTAKQQMGRPAHGAGYQTEPPATGRRNVSESPLRRPLRILLTILAGLLGLSAIPGGVALLINFQAPPVEQLKGSPFSDFTIPGLALLLLVGGTAVLAAVLLVRHSRFALTSSAFSGVVVMIFEFVEVLVIGSPPGPARVMQVGYFAIGVLLVAFSLVAMHVDTHCPSGG